MEKEFLHGIMDIYIKEIGEMIIGMEKEFVDGRMEVNIKETGKVIK